MQKDKSNINSAFRQYVLNSGVLRALRQALNKILTVGMWRPTVLRNG
jgi:hypothetical protein